MVIWINTGWASLYWVFPNFLNAWFFFKPRCVSICAITRCESSGTPTGTAQRHAAVFGNQRWAKRCAMMLSRGAMPSVTARRCQHYMWHGAGSSGSRRTCGCNARGSSSSAAVSPSAPSLQQSPASAAASAALRPWLRWNLLTNPDGQSPCSKAPRVPERWAELPAASDDCLQCHERGAGLSTSGSAVVPRAVRCEARQPGEETPRWSNRGGSPREQDAACCGTGLAWRPPHGQFRAYRAAATAAPRRHGGRRRGPRARGGTTVSGGPRAKTADSGAERTARPPSGAAPPRPSEVLGVAPSRRQPPAFSSLRAAEPGANRRAGAVCATTNGSGPFRTTVRVARSGGVRCGRRERAFRSEG